MNLKSSTWAAIRAAHLKNPNMTITEAAHLARKLEGHI